MKSTIVITLALTLGLMVVAGPAAAAPDPSWSAAVALSAVGDNPYGQRVVVAPNGTQTVIWLGTPNALWVRSSHDGGASWTTTKQLGAPGTAVVDFRLMALSGNTLVALWHYGFGGAAQVQSSRSTDDGATWSIPVVVVAQPEISDVSLAAFGDTTVVATWRAYVFSAGGYVVRSSTSQDGGQTWLAPTLVSPPGTTGIEPRAIAVSAASSLTFWYVDNGGDNTLMVSRSTDAGVTWLAPQQLSSVGADASTLLPIVLPDGAVAIIWTSTTATATIVSRSSTDGGASWQGIASVSGVSTAPSRPALVASPVSGLLAVAWEDNSSLPSSVQVATSSDGGAGWSAGVTVSDPSHAASTSRLAVAPDGTVTAAWTAFSAVQELAVRSSTDGGVTWGPTLSPAAGSGYVLEPAIAAIDGAITVAWAGSVGADQRILASTFAVQPAVVPPPLGPGTAELPAMGPSPAGPIAAALLTLGLGVLILVRQRRRGRVN